MDVKYSSENGVATVLLDRAPKHNALSHEMFDSLHRTLPKFEADPETKAVVIEGVGDKAFCAGGDLTGIVADVFGSKRNDLSEVRAYSAREFAVFHWFGTSSKPNIAILDGIAMGAGLGVSAHANFRIATERTVAAMPETKIGYFTDAGASFFLSRFDHNLGVYLACTSHGLKGYDNVAVGLASHYIPSHKLGLVKRALAEATFTARPQWNHAIVKDILDEISEGPPPGYTFPYNLSAINEIFSAGTIGEVISRLEAAKTPFAVETLATLRQRSPTSVVFTFELIRQGAYWSFQTALRKEFNLNEFFLALDDLTEGINNVIIHKVRNRPNWNPATIEEVDMEFVRGVFRQLDRFNVGFFNSIDFYQYPPQRVGARKRQHKL